MLSGCLPGLATVGTSGPVKPMCQGFIEHLLDAQAFTVTRWEDGNQKFCRAGGMSY